jgi:hypothetical protein
MNGITTNQNEIPFPLYGIGVGIGVPENSCQIRDGLFFIQPVYQMVPFLIE